MLITKAWLEARGACPDQVAIFDAEWPEGVDVNLETLLRAARLRLNLSWLAGYVLKGVLWVEYKRQAAPLRVEYLRQVALLRAEYERQADSFIAEFYRQVAPILWELIQSQEAQGH